MHTKFTIREASAEDDATIAQLSVLCWQQAYRDIMDADFLAQLDWQPRATGRHKFFNHNPNACSFIAEVDGNAVGFCDAGQARPEPKYPILESFGEIYALYVLEELHNQGIGSALCQEACEYLIKHGYKRCIFWTLAKNDPAIRFYKAIGCEPQTWIKREEVDNRVQDEVAFTLDLL